MRTKAGWNGSDDLLVCCEIYFTAVERRLFGGSRRRFMVPKCVIDDLKTGLLAQAGLHVCLQEAHHMQYVLQEILQKRVDCLSTFFGFCVDPFLHNEIMDEQVPPFEQGLELAAEILRRRNSLVEVLD